MKTLNLNPVRTEDTDYPLGTILKVSNLLIKTALGKIPKRNIYVKVVQDPRPTEPCLNCFLRTVSPCHQVFSCVSG